VNSHDVAIVPECEECGERWRPADSERWRAEFFDDGPEDRLGLASGAPSVGIASSAEMVDRHKIWRISYEVIDDPSRDDE
jgi:hypothetical protein